MRAANDAVSSMVMFLIKASGEVPLVNSGTSQLSRILNQVFSSFLLF